MVASSGEISGQSCRLPRSQNKIPPRTTYNGRQPPMEDDLQWKTTSNGRRPPMEDDLKILKVEYLSNHSSDPPQILNLSSGDQTKI